MNRNQRGYDLPDLPKTSGKKGQEFWNPDGKAFQQQIPINQPSGEHPACGRIRVVNGFLVCNKCKNPHSIPVADIDKFIAENPDLMEPLTHKVP